MDGNSDNFNYGPNFNGSADEQSYVKRAIGEIYRQFTPIYAQLCFDLNSIIVSHRRIAPFVSPRLAEPPMLWIMGLKA